MIVFKGGVMDQLAEVQTDTSDVTEPEKAQAKLALAVFGADTNYEQAAQTQREFIDSGNQAQHDLEPEAWLVQQLNKYPQLFRDEQEIRDSARDIVSTIETTKAKQSELQDHLARGNSRESWIVKQVEQGATAHGVAQAGEYAASLDQALRQANENMLQTITRSDGQISQSLNLDGFIAERHHVETFNLDAQLKGSNLRAEMRASTEANSVDIVVRDETGKVVRRYQSKYGQDADATQKMFERGDYRGQRKLVPEGQDVANSTDHLECDGIQSEPLSKQDAKTQQEQAQQQGEVNPYDWNTLNRTTIAKQLGKQVLAGVAISGAFHGLRILGRRLNGNKQQTVSEELRELFESTVDSGADVATQVAASGALLVAARSGWLGQALKYSPAGRLANIAMIGIENAKVLYRYQQGQLSAREALDEMSSTTTVVLFSVAAATEGASLGAAIGTVLGPLGSAAGAIVGGVAAGMAGSRVGQAVYEGGKAVAQAAVDMAKGAARAVGSVVDAIGSGMRSFASSLGSLFS